jgi:hypothetical protein
LPQPFAELVRTLIGAIHDHNHELTDKQALLIAQKVIKEELDDLDKEKGD